MAKARSDIFMFVPEGWIRFDTASDTYQTASDLFIDAIAHSYLLSRFNNLFMIDEVLTASPRMALTKLIVSTAGSLRSSLKAPQEIH